MLDAVLDAPPGKPRTDPARFEVVKNALYSAAEEVKIDARDAHAGILLLQYFGRLLGGALSAAQEIDGSMLAAGGSAEPRGEQDAPRGFSPVDQVQSSQPGSRRHRRSGRTKLFGSLVTSVRPNQHWTSYLSEFTRKIFLWYNE